MLAEFESRILALIDALVDEGSDDELFASGYLRGHVTLAVSEVEHSDNPTPEALYQQVNDSLQKAIQAGELSPPDQALVQAMWEKLYHQA